MSTVRAIHAGRRQLGIDQEDARDLYERVTGKRHLTDMTPREQEAVVGELRRMGFKQTFTPVRKKLDGRFVPILQALWIAGWNLGIVRDHDDAALLAFVQRQTGLDHIRFVHHPEDAARAIEALKSWLSRVGGVDWQKSVVQPPWTQVDGYRIASAQYRKLCAADGDFARRYSGIAQWAGENCGLLDLVNATNRDWQPAMNRLGELIRGVGK